jgi:hypothetical protein
LGLSSAILATRASNLANITGHSLDTLAEIRSYTAVHIVSSLLSIAGGILVIFLIKAIMRRQTEKFDLLISERELGPVPG